MNKRGMNNIYLFLLIFASFLGLIFFGFVLYGFSQVSNALNQDVDIGQVNLADVNNYTFGLMTASLLAKGDLFGLVFIFGMILFMIANAFIFKSEIKIFIIVDILLLIGAFILSIYISNYYQEFLSMMDLAGITTYADNLTKSSIFLLNLPYIVGTLGVIIMIISYIQLNDRPKIEEGYIYGY